LFSADLVGLQAERGLSSANRFAFGSVDPLLVNESSDRIDEELVLPQCEHAASAASHVPELPNRGPPPCRTFAWKKVNVTVSAPSYKIPFFPGFFKE
jgi:hypothetical protein